MPVRAPEDMPHAFTERFNAGDIDGLVDLYESEARLVPEPGQLASGKAQIREALTGFLALKGQIALTANRLLAGPDIAVASNTWTLQGTTPDGKPISLGGTTTEVLHRQSDGTWLFAIDDPYSQ